MASAAFTALNPAQSSSTVIGLPSISVNRSSRNASVELPSVNSDSTIRKTTSGRGRSPNRMAGGAGCAAAGAADFPAVGTSGSRSSSATAMAPGMIVMPNSSRYRSGKTSRNAAANSGPTTAPVLSIARWKPYTRPRDSGRAHEASMASRGAPRIPLPMRSTNRIASTCCQIVTSPVSGRIAEEMA